MELWIRSQDKKKLCKATSFELDNNETGIFVNNYDGDYVYAGKYKTKERALEVLDEIQTYIEKQGKTEILSEVSENGIVNRLKYYSNVYEMPKE